MRPNYLGIISHRIFAIISLLCLSSFAFAQNVLIIYDDSPTNTNTLALKTSLENQGFQVTVSAVSESSWNNTNPSLIGFDAVIHLNGTSYNNQMPLAGQVALVNFVQNDGGIYVGFEWNAYQVSIGQMLAMVDLIPIVRTTGVTQNLTYNTVPAQASHPVLSGIPSSFTINSVGANQGPMRAYGTEPAVTLMTQGTNAGLVYRAFGEGHVLMFSHAGNYTSSGALSNTVVGQLIYNLIEEYASSRNRALNFDGIDDYVQGSDAGFPSGNSARTMDAWIKTTKAATSSIVEYGNVSINQRSGLLCVNGHLYFVGESNDLEGTITINDGKWHHVAMTHNGTTTKLYVDGVLDGTDTKTLSTTLSHFRIGMRGNSISEQFDGHIDEMRIWDTELTEAQIRANMCRRVQSSDALYTNLVNYYSFNQFQGSVLADLFSTNDGTLTNMDATTDWELSGSAVGDNSVYTYNSASSLSISGNSGSNTTIDNFSSGIDGIHLYYVNGNPLSSSLPSDVSGLSENEFYGVFKVGSGSYDINLDYSANTNINGVSNEENIRLLKRDNGQDTTWQTATGALRTITSTKNIFLPNQTGTEYVTGFANLTYPTHPGSGYALDFDGANDEIRITNGDLGSFSTTDSITVETWIKVNNASSSFDVIFNSQGAGTARLRAVLNDGKPRFTIRDASDTPFGIQANTAINDDQWHHLAFVYDGSESTSGMAIFIDGINTATTTTATNTITTATFSDSCYIGARNNANPFIGSIDEMRIWNAALSETQIRSFLAQKTVLNHPSLDRLINYYRFDENTGTTLYDLASGGTGTLFNSPTWTLSGAALGDESSYTYGGSSLSIQEENGDSILINNFVGQLDGMHLYAVNEAPNSTTIYGAESADTNYYFGVFKVGNDTTTYDLTYNYINSALINGNTNEYRAAVASRADNAYASWKSLRAEGTTDQSANTFVLPEQTGTEYIGVIGSNNALAFDGIDDQVTISGFTSPTDFTLEAWINANSYTASYHTILEFGNNDPYFGLINGQPTLYQSAVAPTAINTNQWYHVAASYDSSTQEGKVYVDGALVATSYNTITLSGVGLGIGYNSGDNRFNGMIDEVRIWSRVLCENEIQSHISCQFDAIVQTNLEAYYSFDQGISGGNNTVLDSLFDRSGNGRNGILVGFDKTGTSSNWVVGAPAINGPCSAYFPAQIAVRGNGVIITDGDITPSTSDSTDFGSLTISDSLTINYWVKNTGVDTLKIDSAYVSGADSADFTLSIASNNIASGDSSLLQLKILPSNGDSIFASINLITNICQNPIYNFDVRGEVLAFAGALSFDGTNDFVLISDTLGAVGLSEFTAEAWVKVSGSTGEIQAVFSSTGTEAFHFQLSDSNIHNNAVYTNNGVLFLPVFPRTPHNVWKHIALVAKSGDTRVYVNGAQIGTTNTSTFDNVLVTNNMRIGSGFSSGRFFNGDIDEVRLWDRALSAAEIQANANCELTGNECGLIAYYNFNNQNAFNSGNNTGLIVLGDSSGNGNDGALNNFALSGNSSNWVAQADSVNNSCSANLDALAPNVIPVQTLNVWVNNSGYFVLNANAADSASCDIGSGIETFALSQDTVFCSDNGAQVYLIVTDSADNSDSAAFSVAVFDTIAPNVAVQNISVYLNSSAVSIAAADINNGTTDNCGIASTSISSSSFTCSELGANSVTFYATDLSGNVDSAVATVTVIDSISPTALAIDTTIYLNGAGTVSITSAQIGYGSTDNCSSYTSALDQSSFNCLDTGENVIVLTITDASGNTDTAHATITVLDTLVPTVIAQNLTVYLDGAGNASIIPADVDAGSTDNCGIDYLALSDSSFTCVDAGSSLTIQLYAFDHSGNTDTAYSLVTVLDTTSPIVFAIDTTLYLDANGNASITAAQIDSASSDNCSIASRVLSDSTFDCTEVGVNNITLTVTDVNGNVTTATSVVTVVDSIAPTTIAIDTTIYLSGAGTASVTAAQIGYLSSDNCATFSLTLSDSSFDCTDAGSTLAIILTGSDSYGNSSTDTSYITVLDTNAPVATAQSLTVYLNALGQASITPNDADNGSIDNCSIDYLATSDSAFTCADAGQTLNLSFYAFDPSGNSDTALFTVTVLDTTSPIVFAIDTTLYLDANGNGSITAAQIDSASSDNCSIASRVLSDSTFDCTEVGTNTITLVVTDASGNIDSAFAQITIVDTISPIVFANNITVYLDTNGTVSITSAAINAGSTDNCSAFTLSLNDSIFDCSNTNGPVTVILTGTDPAGNFDTAQAQITVLDTLAPNAVASDTTIYVNGAGNINITAAQIGFASTDNCSIVSLNLSDSSFDCTEIGTNSIVLTIIDANGNSDTDTAVVTVLDTISPNAITIDTTIYLDNNGLASVSSFEIGYLSNDNCAIDSLILSGSTFDCSEAGLNVITLTVIDVNGNSSATTSNITVIDSVSPSALAIDTTIYLDATGNISISSFEIGYGSTDNCNIVSFSISDSLFNCADTGSNTVVITITDASGNQDTDTAVITVLDTIAPSAIAQNLTVYLNSVGQASISSTQVNNGSSDNCSFVTLTLNDSTFDCADLDTAFVILTATDGSGNSHTDTATITVLDTIAPSVFAFSSVDVYLDGLGQAMLTTAMVDSASADVCGIDTMYLDSTNITCLNLGVPFTVTLSVVDSSGNIGIGTATINTFDTLPPNAVAQNLTIYLDSNGFAQITADSVDGGTTGLCSIASIALSDSTFDCADAGDIIMIVFSAFDQSNNEDTAHAYISVLDTIAPAILLYTSVDVYLDAFGNASIDTNTLDSASWDACGIDTMWLDVYDFACANVGANTVTLSAMDVNGNIWSDSTTVNVIDTVAPDVQVVSIQSVALDAFGNITISPALIDSATSDACGVSSLSLDTFNFSCASAGDTIVVTLTAIDSNGNTANAVAQVVIIDTIAPSVFTQNITVYLDSMGAVSITPAMIDSTSSDACGIASFALDLSNFNCSEADSNVQVILTATDVNGNTNSATAFVTVLDTIAPHIILQPITVYLDSAGAVSIAPSDINNGTWDSCGVATTTIDMSAFDCGNVGANTVWFFATDVNGNLDSLSTTVTVLDTIAPHIILQPITVYLDSAGAVSIAPSDINNGTWDSCGVATTTIDMSTFDCGNVGANTVWFFATDVNGNIDSASVTVTVEDTIAPHIILQPITVYLDSMGDLSIAPSNINNGTWDSCGVATTTIDISAFACGNIGANTVWFFATDVNGNLDSFSTTVTVLDTIAPHIILQPITVYLDSAGAVSIAPSEINNGTWDSCGVATTTIDMSTFDCGNVGANTVWFFATDVNGNIDSLSTTVTVLDTIAPSVLVQNITVYLDSMGDASITPADIDAGTWDSCGVANTSININAFDCGNVGSNTVWFFAADVNGNTDSASVTVTVEDTIAPHIILQPITVYLDSMGDVSIAPSDLNNGTWDSCGVATTTIDISAFDCGNIGANTVWFFATDVNGNLDSLSTTVTVLDTIAPQIITQNINVYLDSFGVASIAATDLDNGTWDSCGVASISISQTAFTCADHGDTLTILFTATDVNSNAITDTAYVYVFDTIAPQVLAMNDTVYLDANGEFTLDVNTVNNGTNDACSVDLIYLSDSVFTCAEADSVETIWFVGVDVNGNADSIEIEITVLDTILPEIICPSPIVMNNDAGQCGAIVSFNWPQATDNCSIDSVIQIDTTGLDSGMVFPVGITQLQYVAYDHSGNTDTCSFTIEVQDVEAPVIVCQPDTSICDSVFTFTIPTYTDNCGGFDVIQIAGIASGEAYPVGNTTNTFVVEDSYGNSDTCSFIVTRFDFPSLADAGADQAFCAGNSTNLAGNNPAIGTGYWSIVSGSASIVDSTNATTTVNNFIDGVTLLEWRIENAVCAAARDTVSIENFPTPSTAIVDANVSLCDTTAATISAEAPTSGFGTWLNPEELGVIEDSTANVTSVSGLAVADYYFVWKVENGVCPASFDTIYVNNHPLPVVDAVDVEYIFLPSSVDLVATSDLATSWNWWPKEDIYNDTLSVATVQPDQPRIYYVEGFTQFGCSAIDSVYVGVNINLGLPTAFTPDGDNMNDVWNIKELDNYPDCTVEVYDRTGHKIFNSEGYNEPWDGTYNGNPVDIGAYYYVIRVNRDQIIPLTGSITVIR